MILLHPVLCRSVLTKDLMDKLTKLPPMDEATFKQKLNELIAGYTKGKDEGKLRIIVK